MHVNNSVKLVFVLVFFLTCCGERKEATNKTAPVFVIKNPTVFIEQLPKKLSENSALLYHNNFIWTCNDSGGENEIYGFTTVGNIAREVEIENARNRDWEDMAQDEKSIYIGDFGNNSGARKDLKVYKISKNDIENASSVTASEINFSFANQKEFRFSQHSHRFDCEAIADLNDELYLFTKDWENEATAVYKIPKTEGTYNLQPSDSLQVNGLITGADFSPDGTKLALIGYHDFTPILRIFNGVSNDNVFGTEQVFITIDSLDGAQTEGVCFWGNDSLLVSCEETSQYPAQVFILDLNTIKQHGTY